MPYWEYKCPKCGFATEFGKIEVICLMMVEQLTAILELSNLLVAFLTVLIVLNVVLLTWVTFK